LIRLLAIVGCLIAATIGAKLPADEASETPIELNIKHGIQGLWRVGYETPLRISTTSNAADWQAELQTVDGDGVPIIHSGTFQTDNNKTEFSCDLIVRHGRNNRSIRLKINSGDRVLLDRELTQAERGTALPLHQPWIVTIGKDLSLSELSVPSAHSGLPSLTLTSIEDAEELPRSSLIYGSVNRVIFCGRDEAFLKSIDDAQGNALADWVERGGKLQAWLGSNVETISQLKWLSDMIPGALSTKSVDVDSTVIESYVSASQTNRLEQLSASRIEVRDGRTLLAVQSADRESIPFVVRSAYGAGRVEFVAIDVNHPSLLRWKERISLIERLLNVQELKQAKETSNNNSAQFIGYNDAAGQIRSTLDLFDSVGTGSFAALSIFIAIFLGLVGPIDYFLLHKSMARSVWTWLTLAVCCVLLIIGSQSLTAAWKPAKQIINSLEVVDFHYDTGKVNGQAFVHQYSGAAHRYHLTATAQSLVAADVQVPTYLRWAGKTGAGLGGFESNVRMDAGMPTYQLADDSTSNNSDNVTTEIHGVGIPTAGTYAARASWLDDCSSIRGSNQLTNYAGSDLLEGTFTNPLQHDLINPILYYESWAYPLRDRLKVGDSISLSIQTTPRDILRHLQQQRIVNDKVQSIPWNRAERRNAPRMIDLFSLYDSCGGQRYVGLELGYLENFNLSGLLQADRAILIARVEQPIIKWNAATETKSEVCSDGYRNTFVRLILPIEDR
jgi:hypothetical protein